MSKLTGAVHNFLSDEDGAALVEYGILVALIAVVAIVVIATVGNKVSEKFSAIAAKL